MRPGRTVPPSSFLRSRRGWLAAAAIVGASIFGNRSARGDEPGKADRLFTEGLRLVHGGECARAREKFAESYAADPAPGTLINWALCEEKLGRTATAFSLLRIADDRLPPGHPKLSHVKNHLALLRDRVPYLRIHPVRPLPAGTVVIKDTVQLESSYLEQNQPTDPGPHVIEVHVPGHEVRRYEVTLNEGRTVDLAFEPGLPLNLPATRAEGEGGNTDHRVLGWVIGGTGLAAIGVGTVSGLLALSRRDAVRSDCNLDTRQCKTERGNEAAASGRTWATVSTVAFVAGGVGLIGGAYFLLRFRPAAASGASGSFLVVAPNPQGIQVSGTF